MNANYKSIILAISLFLALSASILAAPGDLDPTFGNGGIVITRGRDSYQLDVALGMAIQSDGKIIVVGSGNGVVNVGGLNFTVVRYNTNGSLDSSFGGTGIVQTPVGNSQELAYSVAIQADGKIVVAGISYNNIQRDFNLAIVRYNPNGSLDTSFGGTGKVINVINSASRNVGDLAIQADGKIVAAGGSALFRYNTNGTLDASFGGTGMVIIQGGVANSVAIQSDGKIVAAGESQNSFEVARYNADGSQDTSFNGSGIVITPVDPSYAVDLAIQTDGKIVIVGNSASGDLGRNFVVVRFNPNGSLDTTFNGTGKVTTPFCCLSYAIAVAIQADGKIVVAGGTDDQSSESYDFLVVRYQGDGAPPTPTACPNPIDCAEFFVRQHYRDFLNREPDAPGLAHWTSEITACNDPSQRQPGESLASCLERKRANTSAAFFLSPEFQNTGSFVLRVYWGTLGKLSNAQCASLPSGLSGECRPLYGGYVADMGQVAKGIVVNDQLAPEVINANKRAFVDGFVNTSQFKAIYDSLSNQQFVDKLFATTGIAPTDAERSTLVSGLNTGAETRSSVVFKVVDGTQTLTDGVLFFNTRYGKAFYDQEFAAAFVFMEYAGYLHRNPDQAGYDHWLNKLKLYGNWQDAQMVMAFILSPEYRQRFGQP